MFRPVENNLAIPMLALRAPGDWKVPVLATNAVDRTGLSELSDAVERKAETRETRGPPDALGGRTRRLLAQSVAKHVEHRVLNDTCATVGAVVPGLQQAGIGLDDAIAKILTRLYENQKNGQFCCRPSVA